MELHKKPPKTEEESTEGRNILMTDFLKRSEQKYIFSQFVQGYSSRMQNPFKRNTFKANMLSSRKAF